MVFKLFSRWKFAFPVYDFSPSVKRIIMNKLHKQKCDVIFPETMKGLHLHALIMCYRETQH